MGSRNKQRNRKRVTKVNTKRKLGISDIDILSQLLEDIWALGDQDEMSIKHIGHALAALVTWQDWRKGLDYSLPGMDLTDKETERLEQYWKEVTGFCYGVPRDELISVFSYLPIAVYGAHYLDLFSDYYKEPAKEKQWSTIERFLSNAEDSW